MHISEKIPSKLDDLTPILLGIFLIVLPIVIAMIL